MKFAQKIFHINHIIIIDVLNYYMKFAQKKIHINHINIIKSLKFLHQINTKVVDTSNLVFIFLMLGLRFDLLLKHRVTIESINLS